MNKKLILYTAIALTLIAEFASIYGLSKLLSGQMIYVILMGIILCLAKIVVSILLKTEWNVINKFRRFFLIIALIILCLITSLGIYGFLSDAYSGTKRKDDYVQIKIELIRKKKLHFEENAIALKSEISSSVKAIQDLRTSLTTNNQTQQVIKGQLVTNIQSTNKSGIQKQLDKAIEDKDKLDQRLLSYNDSIQSLDLRIIEVEQSSEASSELGPLKYISSISGIPMDHVVNYLLLLLIFVFDPLAIILLWSYFDSKPKSNTESTASNVPEPTIIPPIEEQPKVRNIKKPLGRPKKKNNKKEVNNLIDSIINNEPKPVVESTPVIEEQPKVKPKRRSNTTLKTDIPNSVEKTLDNAIKKKV